MKNEKIIIAITHGDINGIGYEVITKTLQDVRIVEMCTPVVYGSAKIAAYHRKTIDIANFSFLGIHDISEVNYKKANIINVVDENTRVEFGKSTEIAGEAALISLTAAVKDVKNKLVDALITAPINKYNIQSKDFDFPGHTEYLEKEFGGKALMLMISENLRIGVVTGHIPISKVSETITIELIMEKLRILNQSLIQDFGIRKPRIAVLGLNPHAGDNGVIGNEEIQTIIPAIDDARKQGIMAIGPYPADGFFATDDFKKFDAILAMYHDQGLTPFKAWCFDNGVNYTAGLSIVRTSPAHGTAYQIAGKGVASENSFRQALYLACDIVKNRQEYNELIANALKPNKTENHN
jgi:4-hydroxythreonine-4-phosphate dehydrogenase